MEQSGSEWKKVVERRERLLCLWANIAILYNAKGRIIVPVKFRESLGDNFVVTKGLDNCLFVYTKEDWRKFEEKLRTLPLTNKNAEKVYKILSCGSCRNGG